MFPYPAQRFDTVMAISVLTHMLPSAVARYLSESHRVTRPGVRLIASAFIVPRDGTDRAAAAEPPLRPSGTGEYLCERADDPEAFVGLWADDPAGMLGRTGWQLAGVVRRGIWVSGTEADPLLARRGFRQDVIVADRSAGPG